MNVLVKMPLIIPSKKLSLFANAIKDMFHL